MKALKNLSIFIPFYNEEKNLQSTVSLIQRAARAKLHAFEIILVDDGSTDDSGRIAQSMSGPDLRVITLERNSGFGIAYLTGFQESRYPFAMYLCADGDVTEKELLDLFENWDGASNQIQYCTNGRERHFWRYCLSQFYTWTLSLLGGKHLPYFNGFNILSTANKDKITAKDFGFSTQAYLTLHAVKSPFTTHTFGMKCQFNDAGSKSINFRNVLKTLKFFSFVLRER